MVFENRIVYGPVLTRRFGWDLGINLLPLDRKLCTFDCVYCQYGFTSPLRNIRFRFPSASEVISKWLQQLRNSESPSVVHTTVSGNGEPTMHPQFPQIARQLAEHRNLRAPKVKLALLSNGYRLQDSRIRESLRYFDEPIIKLDSAVPETLRRMNQPLVAFDLARFIESLQKCEGIIIQTMLIRGWNDSSEEIRQWMEALNQIWPSSVQIYTIARGTPVRDLAPLTNVQLNKIAEQTTRILGIPVTAYY